MATVNIHIREAAGLQSAQGYDRLRAVWLALNSVTELLGALPPGTQVYADDLYSLLRLLGKELDEGIEQLGKC